MPQLALSVPREIALQRLTNIVAMGDQLLAVDPNRRADGRVASRSEQMLATSRLGLAAREWADRAGDVLVSIFHQPPYGSYDLLPPPGGHYPKVELIRNLLLTLSPPARPLPQASQQSAQLAAAIANVQAKLHPLNIERVALHPKVLERCKELYEAGKYDEAILNGYKLIEVTLRGASHEKPHLLGTDLATFILNPANPILRFSDRHAEQEAAHALYRGAIGLFKNPLSHRFLDIDDRQRAFELLTLASLLLRLIDEMTTVPALSPASPETSSEPAS